MGCTRLYKSLCRSVGPSVGPSVCPSHCAFFNVLMSFEQFSKVFTSFQISLTRARDLWRFVCIELGHRQIVFLAAHKRDKVTPARLELCHTNDVKRNEVIETMLSIS